MSFAPVTLHAMLSLHMYICVSNERNTRLPRGGQNNTNSRSGRTRFGRVSCLDVLEYAGTRVTAVGQEVSAGAFRDAVPRMLFAEARGILHSLKY